MHPADALETIGDDTAYLTRERTHLQELCDELASDVTLDAAASNCEATIDVDLYWPHPITECNKTNGELRIGLEVPLDGDSSRDAVLLFVANRLARYSANILSAVGNPKRRKGAADA